MNKSFFIVLSLLFNLTTFASSPKSITIGILPGGNPKALETEAFILAEKLQSRLNLPIQIFISKDYSGMIDALKSKKVDFAILSSMTYVVAEKEAEIKVLMKKTWNNGAFYYSAIVSRANSKMNSVKDLVNKNIAFVDEKSTSGYLYPQVYLRKSKIDEKKFKSVVFSGNHASSIKLLESGKVDAVAVFSDDEKAKTGAWSRFADSKKFKIKALWVSDPIPNDPIVVRQAFYNDYPKLTHDIMYNMIEIQNETGGLTEVLGSSDLMPATSSQYEPVREVFKIFQNNFKL